MNKISSAYSAEGQPFQSPLHLDFLQNASKEAVSNAIIGMIGDSYSTSVWYRLFGAELIPTAGDYYYNSAGAVFYNGEVYTVDAVSGGGGTNMPDGIKLEVVETGTGATTMASGASRNLNLVRKARYANDPAGADTSWRPTEIRINSISEEFVNDVNLTVKFDCNRYYYIAANAAGTMTITLDLTGAVVGGRAYIYFETNDITGNNIVLSTTGVVHYVASGGTMIAKIGLIQIDYAGLDTISQPTFYALQRNN